MPAPVACFYDAMRRGSLRDLLAVLTDDFVGHVTEGLPRIGGTHTGPKEMLRRAWLPAHQVYGALPHPDECLTATDGRVVVLGRYRGAPPATGRTFEAAFTHVFRLHDGRIAELRQLTDSQRWVDAIAGDGTAAVARRLFDAVRTRDAGLLLSVYAEDVVIEEDPALPYGGTHRGHEGALAHGAGFASAWDALQAAGERDPSERIFDSAGTAVALWTLRASRGDERLAQPAASVMEVSDGRVARLRMLYHDTGAILRFLRG